MFMRASTKLVRVYPRIVFVGVYAETAGDAYMEGGDPGPIFIMCYLKRHCTCLYRLHKIGDT